MTGRSIKARPFDFPYDGRLDPATAALIVIDLQVDFLSPGGYLARKGYDPAPLRAILPAVNRVIEAARAVGCLVVFTRQGYLADLSDMTEYERWRRRRAGLEGTTALLRGSPGFELVPEIEVRAGDLVADKTAESAFADTGLEQTLRARGIVHLLIAGCTTEVCVHSTLRDASDRNFQCLLIEDACASGDPAMHAAAVAMVTVEDGVFGVVASSEAVIAALHPATARS